ncbi:MAG: hypothetical protein ACREE2_08635 [Stellaceae bacterium]
MTRILAALLLILLGVMPAGAAPAGKCAVTTLALWGDGAHDDTAALNAWFRGDVVVWAQTGHPVGTEIGASGPGKHIFRLSGPIYIPSGTGRRIAGFEFLWPARSERVSGGTIVAGRDPAKPPVASDLVKIGSHPGEGVPFATPDAKPDNPATGGSCLVS